MSSTLVPPFIVDQFLAGRLRGSFSCAALFVDITGFTLITNDLMTHGQHGAEILAQVMRRIFEPIVYCVHERGGFVAYFAGDALTALFPDKVWDEPAAWRAIAAAHEIQQAMADNAMQETPYGAYTFSAKVGAAGGEIDWGIVHSESGHRAAYYFSGSAIIESAAAEKYAGPGDIVLAAPLFAAVESVVAAIPLAEGGRYRLQGAPAFEVTRQAVTVPASAEAAAPFLPPGLQSARLVSEFRQVANLFINIRGNPTHEEISAFMSILFGLQERYGSMLNRIDFGDKGCHLLLFWGAPGSYENDMERAISFALALRDQSPLSLRMGLTYGIAHAGNVGSRIQAEYTCYGQGVNLAARLMSAAPWNEIWLDQLAARKASPAYCALTPLGARAFKGFEAEQPVFRLDERLEEAALPGPGGQLVGREVELARLVEALHPLKEGRRAGVITIVGQPGMGKSFLAGKLLTLLQESSAAPGLNLPGILIAVCQTDEILRESLNPLRYWLRRYFDQSPANTESTNKAAFKRILDDLIYETEDRELRAELGRTRSILGALVDLFWPQSLYEQLTPELRFENSLGALSTLIRAECLRRPLLLLIEDVHWLDRDSITFLRRLTHQVTDLPLALLLTSRTESGDDLIDSDVPQQIVRLGSLDSDSLAGMVANQLERKPTATLLSFLSERTGGNPFFAEQMVAHLAANDLLVPQGDSVGLLESGQIIVPDDVQALLVARLDRLPARLREIVQEASVLGREFEREVLALLSGTDGSLGELLQQAVWEDIWQPLGEQRYLFQHTLLRDAAYRMQVRSRRHQLHQQAARAFERLHADDPARAPRYAEIAYHYDQAGIAPAAVENYRQAGEQAGENYHNDDAVGYFTRALELVEPAAAETRYGLLLGREAILQQTGQREQQSADLGQLLSLAEASSDAAWSSTVYLRRSAYELVLGRYAEAVTAAERAVSFAAQAEDRTLELRARHRWGRILWQQGHYQQAQPLLETALAMAREISNPADEAECLYEMGAVHYFKADYARAKEFSAGAQAVFADLGNKRGELRCLSLGGVIAHANGDYLAAQDIYRRALVLCREIGWRYGEAHILAQLGNTLCDYGAYEGAQVFHQTALQICGEIGNRESGLTSLDTMGLILQFKGELEAARITSEEALTMESTVNNSRSRAYILTHYGYLLVELGELADARARLEEAITIREELGDEGGCVDAYGGLAAEALVRGDLDTASGHVSRVLHWLESSGQHGVEYPVQLYLIAYQVLQERAQRMPEYEKEALRVLDKGHTLLQDRAAGIQDVDIRRQFLENVPFNRALHDAWRAAHP